MSRKIEGGKADNMTAQDIADKFNISLLRVKKQIEIGKKVELEHTKNHELAMDIAMDHLAEMPDYYTRLDKMEKEALNHWKTKEISKSDIVTEVKSFIKRSLHDNLALL